MAAGLVVFLLFLAMVISIIVLVITQPKTAPPPGGQCSDKGGYPVSVNGGPVQCPAGGGG